jgi:hypothetical protein
LLASGFFQFPPGLFRRYNFSNNLGFSWFNFFLINGLLAGH